MIVAIVLHELVDVVPGRAADYAESVARHQGLSASRRGAKDTLLGLFTSIEGAGPAPVGVNFWQVGGWDDLEAQLARQFEPSAQDPDLKSWWLSNLALRTGGFDRLLEPADGVPDVATHRRHGLAGALFLHQIVRTVPGTIGDYLAAFLADGAPAVSASGGRLVGAWRTCLRSDEAVTLVAFAAPADFARYQRDWYEETSPLGRWRQREDDWVRGKETLVLVPRHLLGSPWHP